LRDRSFVGCWPTGSRRRGPRRGRCATLRSWSRRCRSCRRRPPLSPPSSRFSRYLALIPLPLSCAFFLDQSLHSIHTVLNIFLQRDSAGIATQNNELKFRLQAMEQQAQLRDGASPISPAYFLLAVFVNVRAKHYIACSYSLG
jgi:hypothetical protein